MPYLQLLLTALWKMRSHVVTLWRGMKGNLRAHYKKGDVKILWGFSSCTTDMDVLQQPVFLGDEGARPARHTRRAAPAALRVHGGTRLLRFCFSCRLQRRRPRLKPGPRTLICIEAISAKDVRAWRALFVAASLLLTAQMRKRIKPCGGNHATPPQVPTQHQQLSLHQWLWRAPAHRSARAARPRCGLSPQYRMSKRC